MSDSDDDTRALQLARLEVKVDSILEQLREDRETFKERFSDHEVRLRRIEEIGDPKKVLTNVEDRLGGLEKRMTKAERWIHAIPVGVVIAFIVAVGALISYVNGITPS